MPFPSGSEYNPDSDSDSDSQIVDKFRREFKPRKWTEEERKAVMCTLGQFLSLCTLPSKRDIEKAMAQRPTLKSRTWRNIKDFVRNEIRKRRH